MPDIQPHLSNSPTPLHSIPKYSLLSLYSLTPLLDLAPIFSSLLSQICLFSPTRLEKESESLNRIYQALIMPYPPKICYLLLQSQECSNFGQNHQFRLKVDLLLTFALLSANSMFLNRLHQVHQ